jgi:hypothetical protein
LACQEVPDLDPLYHEILLLTQELCRFLAEAEDITLSHRALIKIPIPPTVIFRMSEKSSPESLASEDEAMFVVQGLRAA